MNQSVSGKRVSGGMFVVVFLAVWAQAAVVLAQPAGSAPASAPAQAHDDKLVLGQSGYFKSYYEFGLWQVAPEAIQKEGEELFGKGKLESAFKRYIQAKNVDWSKMDWTTDVRLYFFRGQAGDDGRAMRMLLGVRPAGDWAKVDFDEGHVRRAVTSLENLAAVSAKKPQRLPVRK